MLLFGLCDELVAKEVGVPTSHRPFATGKGFLSITQAPNLSDLPCGFCGRALNLGGLRASYVCCPIKNMSPLGWGAPPFGSSVTANVLDVGDGSSCSSSTTKNRSLADSLK